MKSTRQAIEAGYVHVDMDGTGYWTFEFGDGYHLNVEPMILGEMYIALYRHGVLLTEKLPVMPFREGLPPDPVSTVVRLLIEDQATWPEGHPCRVCGALQREHPDADACRRAECEQWC